MANKKIIIEEENGDRLYPHTLTECVFDREGVALEDKLNNLDTSWEGVTGKPSTFPPSTHTHTASEVTGLPTSLPASGGNADTVDGKHASDFAQLDALNTFKIRSGASTGDGGRVLLQKSSNSTLSGDVAIDAYADKFRVFESAGSARGAYIDFTKCTASAGYDIIGQIESAKSSVSSGKTLVANAITAKGVATSTTAEFATMATNIGNIQTLPTLVLNGTTTSSSNAVGNAIYLKYESTSSTNTTRNYFLFTVFASTNITFTPSGGSIFIVMVDSNGQQTYQQISSATTVTMGGTATWQVFNPQRLTITMRTTGSSSFTFRQLL